MFPLAFVAGWLRGHWWGFISRTYVVWPTFLLMNVFIALKGSHFRFLFNDSYQKRLKCCRRELLHGLNGVGKGFHESEAETLSIYITVTENTLLSMRTLPPQITGIPSNGHIYWEWILVVKKVWNVLKNNAICFVETQCNWNSTCCILRPKNYMCVSGFPTLPRPLLRPYTFYWEKTCKLLSVMLTKMTKISNK